MCKFTFFVSVFHFKRIFQIRLTGRKAAVRAEREGEEGESGELAGKLLTVESFVITLGIVFL